MEKKRSGRRDDRNRVSRSREPDRPAPSPRSLLSAAENVQLATWNVRRGMGSEWKRKVLVDDLIRHGVNFAALQETSLVAGQHEVDGSRLYWAGEPSGKAKDDNYGYGLGFYVCKEFLDNVRSVISVSNRIAVLKLVLRPGNASSGERLLFLVNVYAPNSWKAKEKPWILSQFYGELNRVLAGLGTRRDVVMIVGDFNSKIGMRSEAEESFMGAYGKGLRNENGVQLASFLQDQHLFLANTAFKKRMLHRVTLHWKCEKTKRIVARHQVDYIAIPHRLRKLLRNAESHYRSDGFSDHSLVVASLALSDYYKVSSKQSPLAGYKLDLDRLRSDPDVRQRFADSVRNSLGSKERYCGRKSVQSVEGGVWPRGMQPSARSSSKCSELVADNNYRSSSPALKRPRHALALANSSQVSTGSGLHEVSDSLVVQPTSAVFSRRFHSSHAGGKRPLSLAFPSAAIDDVRDGNVDVVGDSNGFESFDHNVDSPTSSVAAGTVCSLDIEHENECCSPSIRRNGSRMHLHPGLVQQHHSSLLDAVQESAANEIGFVQRQKRSLSYFQDSILEDLSRKQKEIGRLIYNPLKGRLLPEAELASLKAKRNALFNAISKRRLAIHKKAVKGVVDELNGLKDSAKFFELQRMLWKKSSDTTGSFALRPSVNSKEIVHDPRVLASMVKVYFKQFFQPEDQQPVSAFDPNYSHQPLEEPIQESEVRAAVKRLKNRKAPGVDGIHNELLKCSGEVMVQELARLFNEMFVLEEMIPQLGEGVLIPLNKPKKPQVVENARAINLLTGIRKVLSLTVLERIQPFLAVFVRHYQRGFRRGTSAIEIVWSYRFLEACAQKYQHDFHVLGIDMSKAFDTVIRALLLDVCCKELASSEHRILRVLMADTTMRVKVLGVLSKDSFEVWMGTFQGDGISPALFIIYLETALRNAEVIKRLEAQAIYEHQYFSKSAFADDVDFVTEDEKNVDTLSQELPSALAVYNLKENPAKREVYAITPQVKDEPEIKKLGCMISTQQDWRKKKVSAQAAFGRAWSLWLCKDGSVPTKRRVLQACLMPRLTYGMGAAAMTRVQLQVVDVAQRSMIRKALGIHYPNLISNSNLYKKARMSELSESVVRQRYKLFGHILRGDADSPAMQAMLYYFSKTKAKHRGKPATTIAQVLDADFQQAQLGGGVPRRLHSAANLAVLSQIAQDRDKWRDLVVRGMAGSYRQFLKERDLKRAEQQKNRRRSAALKQVLFENRQVPDWVATVPWQLDDHIPIAKTEKGEPDFALNCELLSKMVEAMHEQQQHGKTTLLGGMVSTDDSTSGEKRYREGKGGEDEDMTTAKVSTVTDGSTWEGEGGRRTLQKLRDGTRQASLEVLDLGSGHSRSRKRDLELAACIDNGDDAEVEVSVAKRAALDAQVQQQQLSGTSKVATSTSDNSMVSAAIFGEGEGDVKGEVKVGRELGFEYQGSERGFAEDGSGLENSSEGSPIVQRNRKRSEEAALDPCPVSGDGHTNSLGKRRRADAGEQQSSAV